jgi:hypothetical protein
VKTAQPSNTETSQTERTELYGGQVVIEFTKKGHKYTVTDKGKTFKPPSVTGITGVIDKSGPISGWAVNVTLDAIKHAIHPNIAYPPETLEKIWVAAKKQHYFQKKEAADIGTNAHKWLQLYFAGKNPELPKPELPYRAAVDAGLKWATQHNVRFLDSERPIYSRKYKFSGRMDGLAIVDDYLTLVDFKTGNGIYDEAWLQTAAYDFAYEEEMNTINANEKGTFIIPQRLVIRLGKLDGHFYSQIQNRDTLKKDWKGFLGAKQLYTRLAEMKKEGKETDTSKSWLDEE